MTRQNTVPHSRSRRRPRRLAHLRQRGTVLVVGLVILLVVTMLGISGQQSTVLQERMAGNMRQSNIAFQAAEAGLQLGLTWVEQQALPGSASDVDFVSTHCTVKQATDGATCGDLDGILADWKKPPDEITAGSQFSDVATEVGAADVDYGQPGERWEPRIYIEVREFIDGQPDPALTSKGMETTYYYTVTSIGFGTNENTRAILQSTITKGPYASPP